VTTINCKIMHFESKTRSDPQSIGEIAGALLERRTLSFEEVEKMY